MTDTPASDSPDTGSGRDWQRRLWAVASTAPVLAIVIAILVGIGFGAIGWKASESGSTVWTSRTVLIIDDPYGIATAGDEGILIKLELLRLKYQGLAETDVIGNMVAAKLHLPVNAVLAGSAVTLPANALLMQVVGTSSSPAMAERLSNAMSSALSSYVQNENAAYNVPSADRFFLTVVNPTTRAVPSTTSHSKSAAAAVGLGIFGLLLGFVLTQLIVNRRFLAD